MTNMVRIPKVFLEDCNEMGDCEVPEPVRVTKKHYWISTDRNDYMDELISRAIYYADIHGGWCRHVLPINQSARFTLVALYHAGCLTEHEVELCNKYFEMS